MLKITEVLVRVINVLFITSFEKLRLLYYLLRNLAEKNQARINEIHFYGDEYTITK